MSEKGKQVRLECQKRSAIGSRAVAQLREAGLIPAVMYGHRDSLPLEVNAKQFHHTFHEISENVIIDLKIGKQHYDAIIKDYQVNPINDRIVHLDFFEIERGKVLKTHVHLVLFGSAAGVRAGGVLEQPVHELEIECLPKDLPQDIKIDISSLEIGQSLRVAEIPVPEGVTIISNAEQVIMHIDAPRIEVEEKVEETTEEEIATEATEEE